MQLNEGKIDQTHTAQSEARLWLHTALKCKKSFFFFLSLSLSLSLLKLHFVFLFALASLFIHISKKWVKSFFSFFSRWKLFWEKIFSVWKVEATREDWKASRVPAPKATKAEWNSFLERLTTKCRFLSLRWLVVESSEHVLIESVVNRILFNVQMTSEFLFSINSLLMLKFYIYKAISFKWMLNDLELCVGIIFTFNQTSVS